jgi:septal ring factor EnvC (AmiA/AmiB activator)/cell division protein FtsX
VIGAEMAQKAMENYGLAVREGLRNFRRGRTLSFAMMGSIAVAVFAVGAFGLVALNISLMFKRWESRVELVAFLSHDLPEQRTQELLKDIRALSEVDEARLISGRESWEELFAAVKGSLDLDEIPLDEILPASIVVKLIPGKRDLTSIRRIGSKITSFGGVEEVKFEELLLERYMQLRRDLLFFAAATSIFWILIFGIITANIARLASAARKQEVNTLRMLGASRKFMRRVFAVEGIAQGIAGSVIGIGILIGAGLLLATRMEGTMQLSGRMFAAAAIVGPALGLLASWFLFRNVTAVVIAVLLVSIPHYAFAQPAGMLEREISKYQHELERVQEELEETRTTAKRISKQERAIIDELQEVEKDLDSIAQEIRASEARIGANQEEIERTQKELVRHEAEFRENGKKLEQWLKLLCNSREPTMIEVVLYDIPQSRMTRRREMLALLAEEEAKTVRKAERLRSAVRSKREALNKRLELDMLHTETMKLRATQSVEKKEQREMLLTRLREQHNVYMAAVKDLGTSARRLQEMIESQRGAEQSIFPGSVPFRTMKGLLPWPVMGEVTVAFGRLRNPGSSTYTRHLGVDISAGAGSEIRAIHDALVVYSDWFRGYGKLVILDHGDGYNSVYAHCSEIFVQKDDSVRAGQIIAKVGETGSLKGPLLYFEIRENGQPVDPAIWLQRRNINATQSD